MMKTKRILITDYHPNPTSDFLKSPKSRGYFVSKRIFDISVSILLILTLLPLLGFVALMIKLNSKGSVLFKQTRLGLNGKPFDFYKFRSMRIDIDDNIHREYTKEWIESNEKSSFNDGNNKVYKIVKDPRIIPVIGNFIRKYSIDELPQLINVLKGDMSLIGPRPPIPYEVENYNEWHKQRFKALPGLTGLWQVSGRNKLTFKQMIELDLKYIENASFKMDLKIALKTPLVILFDKAY